MRSLLARVMLTSALLFAGHALAAEPAQPRSLKDTLDFLDDLFWGNSSHARSKMNIITEHYTRNLSLESWSKGRDRALTRILEPQKERGTSTLRSEQNIWNFLPSTGRVVKVPTSMMGSSWMGSHLTNDDLVKQSRLSRDYAYEQTFSGQRDGVNVTEIGLKPKPDAAVPWGKVVITVRAADSLPIKFIYYDDKEQISRTVTYSNYKQLGGRLRPSLVKVQPADKPKEYTELSYDSLETDVALDDNFFSLRTLEK